MWYHPGPSIIHTELWTDMNSVYRIKRTGSFCTQVVFALIILKRRSKKKCFCCMRLVVVKFEWKTESFFSYFLRPNSKIENKDIWEVTQSQIITNQSKIKVEIVIETLARDLLNLQCSYIRDGFKCRIYIPVYSVKNHSISFIRMQTS